MIAKRIYPGSAFQFNALFKKDVLRGFSDQCNERDGCTADTGSKTGYPLQFITPADLQLQKTVDCFQSLQLP